MPFSRQELAYNGYLTLRDGPILGLTNMGMLWYSRVHTRLYRGGLSEACCGGALYRRPYADGPIWALCSTGL